MNTCPNTFSRKSCLTSNPDRSTTASPRVNRSQRKNHRLKPLELPSFKVISRPPRGFLSTREPLFPTFWTRNSRRDSDHPPSLPLSEKIYHAFFFESVEKKSLSFEFPIFFSLFLSGWEIGAARIPVCSSSRHKVFTYLPHRYASPSVSVGAQTLEFGASRATGQKTGV